MRWENLIKGIFELKMLLPDFAVANLFSGYSSSYNSGAVVVKWVKPWSTKLQSGFNP